MDDPSLLPFLNNNGNGHHYSMDIDEEIEHEEDELDEDDLQDYEQNAPYPEDEIDEDEIEEDEIDDDEEEEENQNEQEIRIPPPPPPIQLQQTIQSERGGRRKGVPRRLQLSPQTIEVLAPQQRLLPSSIPKTMTNIHHDEQPILPSDQEDETEEDLNNENHLDESFHLYSDSKQQNPFQLELLSEHMIANNGYFYDENNNDHSYNDEGNIPEIVDDLLADIVTTIVRDVRHQRQKKFKQQQRLINGKTNGHFNPKSQTNGWNKSIQKQEQKMTNGKTHINGGHHTNSIKSSKSQLSQPLSSSTSTKLADPSILFNEFTKMMHLTSQQQLVKQKQSSSSSTSSFTSPPLAKRQKTSEMSSLSQSTTPLSLQQQQQHQQLLWQMTQQLMMSGQPNDPDTSSLLKQQLLGLTPPGTIPKRVGRPPKQQSQPQVMRSSTNMIPPTSHSSTNSSPYERGSFAPRRRGRPPKYVTERGAIPNLSHDLDTSPYDQLFAAIENSVTGNSARTSSTAFQSALASMLGHQTGLSLPPSPSMIPPSSSVVRNGGTASMVKQSAGQTRHSLPASSQATKLSHGDGINGLDMPMMATKKRGPGRPPKSQMPHDSHQILQATKRMNSSSLSNNTNNNFPPTMVPSSPTSFNLNAAFVEMLQQQLPR